MGQRAFCWLGIGVIIGMFGCTILPHDASLESAAHECADSLGSYASTHVEASCWYIDAQAHLAAREYSASVTPEGLQAPNRAHDLRIFFEPSGIRVHERSKKSARLFRATLTGIGRTETPLAMVSAGTVSTASGRVEIRRPNLIEWYRNSRDGLEQGFDIATAPAGTGSLVLELAVTDARASVRDDALVLRTESGRRLSYGNLEAVDSEGKRLAAHMEAPDFDRVRLVVDDEGAVYPIVIDPLLAEIDDTKLERNQASALLGFSVAGAGDVNGDGYDDVIVGSPNYDSTQANEGAAFVYHGGNTGIASNATPASVILSNQANASLGWSVAGAGDVNGDGYADVIVGAPTYTDGQASEGAAFVFLGSSTGIVSAGDPSTADAELESNQIASDFGGSVAGAGDVNGDGYDDVIVSASQYSDDVDPAGQYAEGQAFLFLGSSTGIDNGDPTTADTRFETNQASALITSVAGAGDVNDDGYDDVIIGSPSYYSTVSSEGAAFVFHGSYTGIADGSATAANAVIASGQTGSLFGTSVAGGNLNGDGYDDAIVGATAFDSGETDEGAVFVYLGGASGVGNGTAATADATFQSNQANAVFGSAISTGDFAGDASDDLLVGASAYDAGQTNEGAAFLFLGRSTSFSGGNPSNATARLELSQASAKHGTSVASAGNIDGDNSEDVIVGAPFYDEGQTNEGAAFIYKGSTRYTIRWLLPDEPTSSQSVPEFSTTATVDMNTSFGTTTGTYDLPNLWPFLSWTFNGGTYSWSHPILRQKAGNAELTVAFATSVPVDRLVLMFRDLAYDDGQVSLIGGTADLADFTAFNGKIEEDDDGPLPPLAYNQTTGVVRRTVPSPHPPYRNHYSIFIFGTSSDTVSTVKLQVRDAANGDYTNLMLGIRTLTGP